MFTSNCIKYDERTANDIYSRIINQAALYLESACQTRNKETRKMTETNYIAILDVLENTTCRELSELHADAVQIVKQWDGEAFPVKLEYYAITPWQAVEEL